MYTYLYGWMVVMRCIPVIHEIHIMLDEIYECMEVEQLGACKTQRWVHRLSSTRCVAFLQSFPSQFADLTKPHMPRRVLSPSSWKEVSRKLPSLKHPFPGARRVICLRFWNTCIHAYIHRYIHTNTYRQTDR